MILQFLSINLKTIILIIHTETKINQNYFDFCKLKWFPIW